MLGTYIYLFGAILQHYNLSFLDWMSANRTTIGRGVTSFAAEPTYLGIVFFFQSWILYNLHKGKFNFIFLYNNFSKSSRHNNFSKIIYGFGIYFCYFSIFFSF